MCGGKVWLLADLLAASGRSTEERALYLEQMHADKVSWLLPPRPVSAVSRLQLSWALPVDDLEQQSGDSPPSFWQGRRWCLSMTYTPGSEGLWAYLAPSAAPAYVTAAIELEPVTRRGLNHLVYTMQGDYVSRDAWGGLVAQWGPDRKEWPQVKAWLQQQGLVHPDGCLHLRATVTHVT
jgi:hypothetical protein